MTEGITDHFEQAYFYSIAVSKECLVPKQNDAYIAAFKAVQELQTSLKDNSPEQTMKKMAESLLRVIKEDNLDIDGVKTVLEKWGNDEQ